MTHEASGQISGLGETLGLEFRPLMPVNSNLLTMRPNSLQEVILFWDFAAWWATHNVQPWLASRADPDLRVVGITLLRQSTINLAAHEAVVIMSPHADEPRCQGLANHWPLRVINGLWVNWPVLWCSGAQWGPGSGVMTLFYVWYEPRCDQWEASVVGYWPIRGPVTPQWSGSANPIMITSKGQTKQWYQLDFPREITLSSPLPESL